MIELRQLTWDNFEECIRLELTEEQDNFIASNLYGIAQSYVALLNDELPPMTYTIYHDDTLIGFMMLYFDTPEENEYGDEASYGVLRFMIDKKYQGKGYGKAAMIKALDYIRTMPQGEAQVVYITYAKENEAARGLYASIGFKETGETNDEDELIAKLEL